MPTPRSLRKQADQLEIQGRAALAEAKRIRRVAGTIERLQSSVVSSRLTSSRDEHNVSRGTLATEIVTNRARRPPPLVSTRLAIGAKNTTRSCLFSEWLVSTDQTATSWALAPEHADGETGSPRWAASSVRSWMMASGKSARPIPEDAAKLIEIESAGSVPADDAAWPNGISRPRRRNA